MHAGRSLHSHPRHGLRGLVDPESWFLPEGWLGGEGPLRVFVGRAVASKLPPVVGLQEVMVVTDPSQVEEFGGTSVGELDDVIHLE